MNEDDRPGGEGLRAACQECGAVRAERDARFCPRCGALLATSTEFGGLDPDGAVPARSAEEGSAPQGSEASTGRRPRSRDALLGVAVLVLVTLGLLAFVVTDDGSEVAGEPTADVEAYLASVERIVGEDVEALGRMETVLGGTYTDREAWLAAIDEVLRDTPHVDEMLAAARDLDPPPGYEEAHEAWLTSLEHLQTLRDGLASGIERGDPLNVTIAAQRFWLDLSQVLLIAPRPLCEILAPMTVHKREFCRDPSALPGGPYGQEVWRITRELVTAVFPRTGVRPPTFTDQEELAYLAITYPEPERAVAAALAEIRDLRPPGRLRDDHDALVEFLSAIREFMAATVAAAEAGDLEAARQLSPAPIVREFERRLSDDGRELYILLLPD